MLRDAVEKLWPLSESYEYAAEAGLALRNHAPGWWHDFEAQGARSRFPLPQAQGYAFLRWLEGHPDVGRDQLAGMVVSVLMGSESPMRTELAASVDCLSRSYEPLGDPFVPHELFEQPVALWAPPACAG